MTAPELPRLRARERAKRLVVLGLVVTAYAAGWLLVSWRASRIGETTCTVEPVPGIAYCKLVHHAEDGIEHSLPWDVCDRPTWWAPLDVGGTRHCYYFRSFPDAIFFEPRRYVWQTPGRVGFLASGLTLVAAGVLLAICARRSRPREATPVVDDPYRKPDPPFPLDGPPPRPLVIPRSGRTGCVRWVVATPFALFGMVLAALDTVLMWEATGDVELFEVAFSAFCHGVAFVGLLGLAYRSGLVVDAGRGLVFSWWGVGRPWFFRYDALPALRGADVHVVAGRGTYRELQLQFENGRRWRFMVDDPEAAAARVVAYLAEVRQGRPER
jgi:hypothetical protein